MDWNLPVHEITHRKEVFMVPKKIDMYHSHSSLSAWRRCKFRYYLDKVVKRETSKSLGLTRGSAGHAAIADWYLHKDLEQALEVAWTTYSEGRADVSQEDWELLRNVLIRGIEWSEAHDNFKTIKVEHKFELDIEGHTLLGYIDAVIEWNGRVWLMEHKFNKRAETAHLDLDPQVSVYLLAGLLEEWEPVGVLYNIFRVSNGPTAVREPIVRVPVYRSTEGLQYFVEELIAQMGEVEAFMEKPYRPYRNMNANCAWDCSHKDVCMELNDSGNADHLIGVE